MHFNHIYVVMRADEGFIWVSALGDALFIPKKLADG